MLDICLCWIYAYAEYIPMLHICLCYTYAYDGYMPMLDICLCWTYAYIGYMQTIYLCWIYTYAGHLPMLHTCLWWIYAYLDVVNLLQMVGWQRMLRVLSSPLWSLVRWHHWLTHYFGCDCSHGNHHLAARAQNLSTEKRQETKPSESFRNTCRSHHDTLLTIRASLSKDRKPLKLNGEAVFHCLSNWPSTLTVLSLSSLPRHVIIPTSGLSRLWVY